MNDHIFDMARQAGATAPRGGPAEGVFCFTKDELVEFTQAIVLECVGQIYPQWIKEHGHLDPTNLADAVVRVREHFGIEE